MKNENFNVTLAKDFKASKYSETEVTYAQPKLDGVRCYITKDGAFSRNHKPFVTAWHIVEELKTFFDYYPNAIIDGELYAHEYSRNFEKIISLVKRTKPSEADLAEVAKSITLNVFDVYFTDMPEKKFSDRQVYLRIAADVYKWKTIQLVETMLIKSQEDLDDYYTICMDRDYEGVMVRKDTAYSQKRSWDLQKMKVFKDQEGTIVDVVEGKGKLTGKLGKFVMKTKNGVEFGAPPAKGHNFEWREQAWKNREQYIGKTATFRYLRINPTGAPYLPGFKCVRDMTDGSDL